ncbi:tetratricopeptide repeat protein [Acidovorax sp. BLS4]|uniref:tetratricopeptide repeat protein n=1 Tax=Acidovorax sp. BLS4 TaxID=3273430 RepID=UPI00294331DA|nr:tetratricopeptide repeat protein [Paracidovorax avenae]WOI45585.1 tetratricopeptide repeat protein [Paracidovorax avenae]
MAYVNEFMAVPPVQSYGATVLRRALHLMLEMYPKDKRVQYLAGNWMMGEQQYSRAIRQCEKALAIDKNYFAPMNDLGYAYARQREFDKAFAVMERQIAVRPNQPNPQDSYAEILRSCMHCTSP